MSDLSAGAPVADRRVTRQWVSRGVGRRVASVVLAISVAFVTIGFAPIMLLALDKIFSVNWAYLSNIGQSFNGMSALLSAGALVGLVVTARAQIQQTQMIQEHLMLDTQFNVLKLAINDPDLATVLNIAVDDQRAPAAKKQHIYLTMWLRYLLFLFVTKSISARVLAQTIEVEFGNNSYAMAHWSRVRMFWFNDLQSGLGRQFFEIVDYSLTDPSSSVRLVGDSSINDGK